MLRAVQEDSGEEEAPGSVFSLCNSLSSCARRVRAGLQSADEAEKRDADEQLEFLHLWVAQCSSALHQCKERFQKVQGTLQRADALAAAVQAVGSTATELVEQRKRGARSSAVSKSGSGVFGCFNRQKASSSAKMQAARRSFEDAHDNLRNALELVKVVDTSGEDHFIFMNWLPGLTPPADPYYKRPVAFDTVATYLLADRLPARLLVHGPSGNGKTSLLRQIQAALSSETHKLHARLAARFPQGMKWVDCGYVLRSSSPAFGSEVKQRALALAQDLLPHEDDRLARMDLPNLAAVIREQLNRAPFIVVFDNLWDGSIFRRDCLNILPDDKPGVERKGTILITSQFNLSSICQWHSPETITIPLSAESNISACVSLLASLWSGNPSREDLPGELEALGRKLVRDCEGSPLAIKLLAPLLEGSAKERKWREVLGELNSLVNSLTFKRDSLGSAEADAGASLPRVLYAFQLRARALPRPMRQLLSIFALFVPGQQIPVAAVVHIFAEVCGRSLEEACVLVRGLAAACYLEVRAPYGRLLAGFVSYHGLLKQFLLSMPDYRDVQLPGSATKSTALCLALVVLYAAPAYQQQALQVFSKVRQEEDSMLWEQPSKNRRNPFQEPFWLQLLSATAEGDLATAAAVPVVSAARQIASLAEVTEALLVLFADPRTLLAAAGVFSELAWQIRDRTFLEYLADELESVRALSRLTMRLRELTASEGSMAQAEELAVLAWAFADLAEHVDDAARGKLRSEPVIPLLETRYQGAGVYAYQRLLEILQL